jgi:predicted metalloprotease with PDZ domain
MRSRLAATLALALLGAAAAGADPQEHGGASGSSGERVHFEHFVPGHGRLGVQLQDMTPELREFLHAPKERGVLVVRVNQGSSAEKAGLRVGDVIVAIGGEPVDGTFDVVHAVMVAEKDATLALEIVRDGKTRRVEAVATGEPPMAGAPMRWMRERMPEMRAEFEQRLREVEERLRALEQRLRESAPKSDELDT